MKSEPNKTNALPHALGHEKSVLSTLLQQPERIATAHGLTAESFYLPAHQIVWRHLEAIHRDGYNVELVGFVQRLIDREELEAVGNAAAITELFSYAPNSQHFAQHLRAVHEKHSERLRFEAAYADIAGEQQQADQLRAQADLVRDLANNGGKLAQLISERAFDVANPPSDPPPMVKLGEYGIFTAGNASALIADRKAGKTSALSAILGAVIAPPYKQGDFLGFTAENPAGRAVVHFDTEQSPADHHNLVLRALRRAGLTEPPPWFSSHRLTGLDLADRVRVIDTVCEQAAVKCEGLQMVVIDGIADLCRDPNDQAEAFDLVEKWHNFSVNHACVVLAVLHLNPGTEKSRGHLGSQLERKVETPLRIVKNAAGISTMFATHARKAHFTENEGFSFQWCNEAEMHVAITKGDRDAAKQELKRNKHADAANQIMAGCEPFTYTELVQAIEEGAASVVGVGNRTAKNRVRDWLANGIITKHPNGTFSLK